MDIRKISSVHKAEGAGAAVNRLFPTQNYSGHHDPFVLFDEFMVEAPAEFSEHEHRGFEAVTYMLEGSFVHEDNLGNKSEITKNQVQVFNAGKSLFHSEKPGSSGNSRGLQLWINLPENQKNSDPYYKQLKEVPVIKNKQEITVREVFGEKSPLKINTPLTYRIVELKKGQSYNLELADRSGIVYVIKGHIKINDISLESTEGVLLSPLSQVNNYNMLAEKDSHFAAASGLPHHQDIKIKGSFVI